jgi:hypothetical protein
MVGDFYLYKVYMNALHADVRPMPVTTLQLCFAVHVKAPVEMPPRLYAIGMQEICVRTTAAKDQKRIIYELLAEKILADYNRLIEDSPIMDMFADPIKYERCSYIEWNHIDDFGLKSK